MWFFSLFQFFFPAHTESKWKSCSVWGFTCLQHLRMTTATQHTRVVVLLFINLWKKTLVITKRRRNFSATSSGEKWRQQHFAPLTVVFIATEGNWSGHKVFVLASRSSLLHFWFCPLPTTASPEQRKRAELKTKG